MIAPAPKNSPAHLARGRDLLRANRPAEAIGEFVLALVADPAASEPAHLLARLLQQYTLEASPPVAAALRACFAQDGLDYQPLVRSALNCLMATPAFQAARQRATTEGWAESVAALLDTPDIQVFLADPLLLGVLRRGICHDVVFERFLLALRAHVAARLSNPPDWWRALAAALAQHAINNEYALPIDAAEAADLADLVARLETGASDDAMLLAVLMYRAPPPSLASRSWREPARALLAAAQPDAEEIRARNAIARLSQAADQASQRVAAQYEENPYPRWLSLERPAPGERLAMLRRHLPQSASRDFAGKLDVLIAGCGTGRQAITAALGYGAHARILALDLSAASLAYAARMARRYGVANVEFLQADLRDIAALDRRFDVIEAVGVLHHIADPVAAWHMLVDRLQPGGMMKIGLYSERARAAIVAARAEIARLGLAADIDGIRALRRLVVEAPDAPKDWRHLLPRFVDFFTASGCRDLVFNEVEHRFSPQSLSQALGELGLEFRGFELPARIMSMFRMRHPGALASLDLAQWEAFEAANPDIFAGMFHFWCYKPSA